MPLDRSWERFDGGPTASVRDRMHVTLNRHGLIFMNGNLHRMLGSPVAVKLYFNRETDVIAVEPSNDRAAISFPVRQRQDTSFLIHASPFCKHFGISVPATEKFVEPVIDDAGVLKLDLKKMVRVAAKTRRRTKEKQER